MAKPNTDPTTPGDAPKPADTQADRGGVVPPHITEAVAAARNPSTLENPAPSESKTVTLVKDDHRITTSHPAEINNFRARGYRIEEK